MTYKFKPGGLGSVHEVQLEEETVSSFLVREIERSTTNIACTVCNFHIIGKLLGLNAN